ncbi:fumarylacetoacetate hydrolase [Bradyrhizobium sp. Rc2d]|uniref:fumarylacetoacetase n=1 Tax=Bradyrhizobium sp. Rc2d TaxID=1855321 RepID=UPI0008912794|nr:fumarylacetoacetase [Bradyrhizobium sp. Rc2d]SDJ79894.1 fumarylacetoacetate hydrolase [Bradyrhizobium sp. Rc2d]
MAQLDETHDRKRLSWVISANGHADFPIQNLPLGIFSPPGNSELRGGIAIGDMILDLTAAAEIECFKGEAREAAEAVSSGNLNDLFALGPAHRQALRKRVSELLDAKGRDAERISMISGRILHRAVNCTLHLPARIGDYTDFYAGIHHATNVGRIFRPDNPLLPNYRHIPIGYHGRSSSIVPSGTPVRRPAGQLKAPAAASPSFGLTQRLDYELELGIWIGQGNLIGKPIPISEADQHIAGFCLLNDWSARDIQSWEYQPVGPFLSKNFSTTISPWVITPEAVAPFRIAQYPRSEGEPRPLPYLWNDRDQREGALDLDLEVFLMTPGLREKRLSPQRVAIASTRHMYWTVAQLLAHHTSNGCNVRPGDLFGSGTISAPTASGFGSLIETTAGGGQPIRLESGEERRFLEDGDEVILRARTRTDKFVQIGFGDCYGKIRSGESIVFGA